MSEILLYKANEVAAKLSAAEESVRCELDHLEQSHRLALQTVDEAFGRLEQQLLQVREPSGSVSVVGEEASFSGGGIRGTLP